MATKPADASKKEARDKLLSGKPVHFHPETSERKRTIPAEVLADAAKKHVPIDLKNAAIIGDLGFQGLTLESSVSLVDCHLASADFSYATFKRNLILSGSVIDKGITFQSATVESVVVLDGVQFSGGEANFIDLEVQGILSATRATFADGLRADYTRVRIDKYARFWGTVFGGEVIFDHAILGEADFRGAKFKQRATFNPSKMEGGAFFRAYPELQLDAAIFEDEADFRAAEIGLTADFAGVQFSGDEQPVSFASSKINGDAIFDDSTFAGPASFAGAKITSNAFFRGAGFSGEAIFTGVEIDRATDFSGSTFEQNVSFNSAKIGGSAFFQRAAAENGAATVFKGKVDFVSANIGLVAVFDSAEFTSQEKVVTFESSKIGGNALFRNAHFAGTTSFMRAEIGSTARFDGAKFTGEKTQVNFNGARIEGDASFRGTSFAGSAIFLGVGINGQAIFTGAVFESTASFNSANIKGLASFCFEGELKATRFQGEVDFVAAQFCFGVDFRAAQFTAPDKTVTFQTATFGGNTNFSGAIFGGETLASSIEKPTTPSKPIVDFTFAHFAANAYFDGVQFSVADKPTKFDVAKIDGNISFQKAVFAGEASFRFMKVGGYVQFAGAEFMARERPVSFDGTNISGHAFFFEKTEKEQLLAAFRGEARFLGVCFGGYAIFDSVEFSCSDKPPSFDEAVFSSQTSFKQTTFSAGATFTGSEFRGPASFQSATFLGEAKEKVTPTTSFIGTEFQQGSYFNDAAFHHEVNFRAAQFDVEVWFPAVEFKKKAVFSECRITGSANFGETGWPGTTFSEVSFRHASFAGDAHFENAIFKGPARFRETSFRVVLFAEGGHVSGQEQFQSSLEFGGCTYERIQARWQSLLRTTNGQSRIEPYDRQPYMQLEKVFHLTGRDLAADEVYIERQHVERKRYFSSAQRSLALMEELRRIAAWFFSLLYWRLLNYGVRPYRLIVFTTLLLLLGTGTFLQPEAVTQKAAKPDAAPAHVSLLPKEAFELSLKEFLPIELPMASQWNSSEDQVGLRIRILKWTPSLKIRMRASVFATILLKIPGWILVPLGVGALTGLLRVKAKP